MTGVVRKSLRLQYPGGKTDTLDTDGPLSA